MASGKKGFRDKVRGCLLGVAIGDALGAPFEHLRPGETNQILDKTGGKITDFHPWQGYRAGSWTDDTGMTLAVCRAFIDMARTGRTLEDAFKVAFRNWAGSDESRRAGKTVLYAAKNWSPDIDSWANGALMRTSPVAIYAHMKGLSQKAAAILAYKIARFTHGHPWATFPAVECVPALMSILAEDDVVPERLSDPGSLLEGLDRHARYEKYVEVRNAPIEALHPSTGLRMWRQVFEECFGMSDGSRWSMLPGFEEGILKAVNESFDKDTAGAVAGALLGAYWGEAAIPVRWRASVEKADKIPELADDLAETMGGSGTAD
jgi:ADP-ribosylglycohydrolase